MKNYTHILGGLFTLAFVFVFSAGYGQMKIASNGFTKVGDTGNAAATNLHVAGIGALAGIRFDRTDFAATGLLHTASGNPQFRFTRNGADFAFGNRTGRFHIQPESNISSSGTGLTIDNTGNVGIGILVPSHALDVSGTTRNTSGSWLSGSDKKLKKNIKNYSAGLNEVLAINPITFQYKGNGGIKETSIEIVGVIAQDFQKIAPYAVSEFEHVEFVTTKNKDIITEKAVKKEKFLQVDNGPIKYMLVNAIKEQQQIIEDLQSQINELRSSMGQIESPANHLDIELTDVAINKLSQNQPNPFLDNTEITYSIIDDSQNAQIKFFNLSGSLIKTVNLDSGTGSISISAQELPTGTYSYSLEVDGKIIESKKMVRAR